MLQPDLPAPAPSDVSPLRLRASEFLFNENIPVPQSYKHSQCLKGRWPEIPPSQTEATGFFPSVPPSLLPRPPEVFSHLKLLFKPPKPELSPRGAGIPEGQPERTELTNRSMY